jgi:hypothetical protein
MQLVLYEVGFYKDNSHITGMTWCKLQCSPFLYKQFGWHESVHIMLIGNTT